MDTPMVESDGAGTGRCGAGRRRRGAFGPNAWLVRGTCTSGTWPTDLGVGVVAEFFADYGLRAPRQAVAPPAPADRRRGPVQAPTRAPEPLRHGDPRSKVPPLRGAAAASWPTWRLARCADGHQRSGGAGQAARGEPHIINNQLKRTTGGKVSFTHLIAMPWSRRWRPCRP